MSRIPRTLLLVLLASMAASAALATEPGRLHDEKLDEVLVQAEREKLNAMHQEVLQLEDQFFDKFNALNTDHRFNIHCRMEAATMTLIRKRVCRPEFSDEAEREESVAFLDGHAAPWARSVARAKDLELKDHLRKMTARDPELRKALVAWGQAKDKFEKMRAAAMKDHVIVND
jgi:hypothetical protein